MTILSTDILQFLRATGPEHDSIQQEMVSYAEKEGFPIIGPESGGVLRLLARLTNATRVFEFGSGYGYSAYWFLQGMDDGRIVLTEFDEDELEMGREFFARAELTEHATFEHGDAMETIERYDGPFDIVLIDHQKHRYAEAFERVKPKLSPGGIVIADNIMSGPIDFDRLRGYMAGERGLPDPATDKETEGIGRYLKTVRTDAAFETIVLPIGSGISISMCVN